MVASECLLLYACGSRGAQVGGRAIGLLPQPLPVPVEIAEELDRVESSVGGGQCCSLLVGKGTGVQETLLRSLGGIVDLVDPGPLAGLGEQLHAGLKEVEVEAEDPVEPGHSAEGSLGREAIIPHQPADHTPVLLLDVSAGILLVGPGASESDLVALAVSVEMLIDELTPIVAVQAQEGEGEPLRHAVNAGANPFLSFPHTVWHSTQPVAISTVLRVVR